MSDLTNATIVWSTCTQAVLNCVRWLKLTFTRVIFLKEASVTITGEVPNSVDTPGTLRALVGDRVCTLVNVWEDRKNTLIINKSENYEALRPLDIIMVLPKAFGFCPNAHMVGWLVGWLVGFVTTSSTPRLYCGRVLRLTSDNFTSCHTRYRDGRPWLLSQPVTLYWHRPNQ